jgi:regulatory factor X
MDSSGKAEDRSDDDDDDDSEGATSALGSKRNSLSIAPTDLKNTPAFSSDLTDKTPTVATLLSHAQAAQRPTSSFPPQASIRRHPQHESGLAVQSSPIVNPCPPASFLSSPQPLSVRHLPHFPSVDDAVGSNSTSPQGLAAREVWGWFQDHLDALLESVRSFRFDQFEMHLRTFWSNLSGNHREVVHAPAIAGLMAKADAIVYDVRGFHIQSGTLAPTPRCNHNRKSWSFCDHRCSQSSPQHLSQAFANSPTRWKKYF